MAKFTTRVELHNAGEDDYITLHSAMAREGFSRYIESKDGKTYHLPTAEYNLEDDCTRGDVLARAKRAAASTRLGYEVLVTESAGRTWHDLSPR